MGDVSNMSEEFHEWLNKCPCHYSKKYGEDNYNFYEDEICKENCGPCQNGNHNYCQSTECNCN